jgi:hypothetical protein
VLDAAFAKLFPADAKGEIYISYLHQTDDDILWTFYKKQNQWTNMVQSVQVGKFNNIDMEYDISLVDKYFPGIYEGTTQQQQAGAD